MAYFVYLNGPPKSGKDTLANLLETKYENVVHVKFTQMLRDAVCGIFGIDEHSYEHFKDHEVISCLAFTNSDYIFTGKKHMSYREFVNRLSEKVLKPNFGAGYLGVALAASINARHRTRETRKVYIVSDLGFLDELQSFKHFAGITDDLIIQMHREGCDFSNDSRDYLPMNTPIHIAQLNNDGTEESLGLTGAWMIDEMLRQTSSSLIEKK